jgi:hypothetical protein
MQRSLVEAATNLAGADRRPLETSAIVGTNGTFYFVDPKWTNYPDRL